MPRLIELGDPARHAGGLTLEAGDVVIAAASGGFVSPDDGPLAPPMILTRGAIGTDGTILTPMGPPGTVLFHARAPGSGVMTIVTGDPFGVSRRSEIAVMVV